MALTALRYRLGFALRETGQALERVGCVFQGINSHEEQITRLKPVAFGGSTVPKVAPSSFIAPSASVVGDVTIGNNSSVWYSCSIRGENVPVIIGQNTNLQDRVSVGTLQPTGSSTVIGSSVSVGHGAVLAGCVVEDGALIGMSAVLQDGSRVESGAIVAAGAVVSAHTTVPSGEVWGGNPAKKIRNVKPEEKGYLEDLPSRYTELANKHKLVLELARKNMEQYKPPASA